jgi:hypothetical protein
VNRVTVFDYVLLAHLTVPGAAARNPARSTVVT